MLIKNKKGGAGREWAFALSIIFGIGILYMIFNTVFNYHLAPTFIDLMPDTETGDAGAKGINQYLSYWKFIPYLVIGGVIIYMFILAVKKEPTEYY